MVSSEFFSEKLTVIFFRNAVLDVNLCLFLGNKWNFKKLVSYTEMLDRISQRWPDVTKLSDHQNDTSKV